MARTWPRRRDTTMPEYEFVKYEELEDGKIVRILLNRPETRNAQNRGMLVELDDAFRGAEKDDNVRVVILGGVGPMFSSGHDIGLGQGASRSSPQHPTSQDRRRHPGGGREADAPGVALLLPEHAALAQPAQDHRGPGAGHRLRRRADADVGLRPDRGGRQRRVRRRGRAPGSACAASSTSATPGSSGPARPRSSC